MQKRSRSSRRLSRRSTTVGGGGTGRPASVPNSAFRRPSHRNTPSARDSRSSRLLELSSKYGNLLNGHAEPVLFVRKDARRHAVPKPLMARHVGWRTTVKPTSPGCGPELG
eukprot:scaffold87629_cov90-Phaeocystis_antarctica.AAC.2